MGSVSGHPTTHSLRCGGSPIGWLNYGYDEHDGKYDETNQSTQPPGHNLLDRLAAEKGYVLPLSYVKGTVMGGTASAPTFRVPAYNSTDVANANPNVVANYLNSLISSIKRIFPRTNIVVVGHSNGGLIAEQWWLNHRGVARGIQQVFSLDSPLNGLFDAGFCSIDLCAPFGVSAQLGDYYSALWSSQSKNDPYWATLDAKDKAFTAVGSYGDPFVRRRRQRGDHAADDRRPDRNRFPVVLRRRRSQTERGLPSAWPRAMPIGLTIVSEETV